MMPALAQDGGKLARYAAAGKSSVTVMRDVVRIGDLIENVTATPPTSAIFSRSPDLGGRHRNEVSADDVLEAIRAHDLLVVDNRGRDRDRSHSRNLREVSAPRHRTAGRQGHFAGQYGSGRRQGKLSVTFRARTALTLFIEPQATGDLRVTARELRSAHDRGSTSLFKLARQRDRAPIRHALQSGTLIETVMAPVLTAADQPRRKYQGVADVH